MIRSPLVPVEFKRPRQIKSRDSTCGFQQNQDESRVAPSFASSKFQEPRGQAWAPNLKRCTIFCELQEPRQHPWAPVLKSSGDLCKPQVNRPHQVNFYNYAKKHILQVSRAAPSFAGVKSMAYAKSDSSSSPPQKWSQQAPSALTQASSRHTRAMS